MAYRKILILANSRKMNNRCIAGIDIERKIWIRPCYKDGKNGIPENVRLVDGNEPEILDIIKIPLLNIGIYKELQPENYVLDDGRWIKVGKAKIDDVKKYLEKDKILLNNKNATIDILDYLLIPSEKRKTLILIQAEVEFFPEQDFYGRKRFRANFIYRNNLYNLPVTDVKFENSFDYKYKYYGDCILTISQGLPYNNSCYKFVAGIIPLGRLTRRKI